MKETWVVYLNTNIGNESGNPHDNKTHCFTYETFEEARDKSRELLRSYAYGEPNEIFNGNGILTSYNKSVQNFIEVDDFYDDAEEESYSKDMETVKDAFASMFAGEKVDLSTLNEYGTDWLIAYRITDGRAISIYGEDDGPFNGYDPHIYSDMFDMSEPQNYTTYIDDYFEPYDADGFFEIRIMKSES